MRRAAAPAALSLLLAVAVAACEGEADQTRVAESPPPSTAAAAEDDDLIPIPQPADSAAVGVRLREYRIDMTKDTLPAGPTEFHIVNGGTTSHMFIIRHEDQSEATPHLVPGESTVLEVVLEPGEYRVLCDVRDEYSHLSEGMFRDIVVR